MAYPYGTNFYNNYGAGGVPVGEIIAGASNVKGGENPPFTASDFYEIYPAFSQKTIPTPLLNQLIAKANAKISEARWHSQWTMGMCNYIAHYLTLYLNSLNDASAQGVVSAQGAEDVSVSYDTDAVARDYEGYGSLKTTVYGQMLLDDAKWAGKGGMGIW